MTKQVVLPSGFASVTPRMVVTDVVAQMECLRAVFGATGDVHADRPAEVRIGNSMVLISRPGEPERFPAFLYVCVDDADSAYECALSAGAVSIEPPTDAKYGDRRAMVRDAMTARTRELCKSRKSGLGLGTLARFAEAAVGSDPRPKPYADGAV